MLIKMSGVTKGGSHPQNVNITLSVGTTVKSVNATQHPTYNLSFPGWKCYTLLTLITLLPVKIAPTNTFIMETEPCE